MLIDILINFNKLEIHLKRIVTYAEIKTFKDQSKTLGLSQLITIEEIKKCFNMRCNILLAQIEKNLFVRNSIAHSIPTIFNENYIVFVSHETSEMKKARTILSNKQYKYYDTVRSKILLNRKMDVNSTNYSVMRLSDLSEINKLLEEVVKQIEKVANAI